jgi:hypothetical protein
MYSHQLLQKIAEGNPALTFFVLRMYKHSLNPFVSKKGDFSYLFINADELDVLEAKIVEYETQGFMVGLSSMIMTTSGIRSLLLLDFSVPHSQEAEKELIEKISTFNQSGDIPYRLDGWLIKTNTSYHYLGKHIASPENFRHFLGSSLLFRHKDQKHFVVDDRWLGHQLKRGYGTMRIGNKAGNDYPKVISEIA